MPELTTALYYTLSTISQTLAGALGLFAAFMIIRISAFNQLIYERMAELYAELNYADQTLGQARARGDAKAVFVFYRAHQEKARPTGGFGNPPRMPLNASQELRLSEGEAMVQRKESLLRSVGYALVASAVTIAACFAGLALTPVAGDGAVAVAALVVAVLLGAGCLSALVTIMIRALKES
jgi:hypothetical protein